MFGSWLEKGLELAEKAKIAAVNLDKQLNESVGVQSSTSSSDVVGSTANALAGTGATVSIGQHEDDDLNDAWADDFNDEAILEGGAGLVDQDRNDVTNEDSKQHAKPSPHSIIKKQENHKEEDLQADDKIDKSTLVLEDAAESSRDDKPVDLQWHEDIVSSEILTTSAVDEKGIVVDNTTSLVSPQSETTEDTSNGQVHHQQSYADNNNDTTIVDEVVESAAVDMDGQGESLDNHVAIQEDVSTDVPPIIPITTTNSSEAYHQLPQTPSESTHHQDVVTEEVPSSLASPQYNWLTGMTRSVVETLKTTALETPITVMKTDDMSPMPATTEGWMEEDIVDVDLGDSQPQPIVLHQPLAPTASQLTTALAPSIPLELTIVPDGAESMLHSTEAVGQGKDEGEHIVNVSNNVESFEPPAPDSSMDEVKDHHMGSHDRDALAQQIQFLQVQLEQRESQLFSKTEQFAALESMHESEKLELQRRIQTTKEEAKRRIQKAKERVETMEQQLHAVSNAQSSTAEDTAKQAEIIFALRGEGEKLALKQSEMEKAVRAAKGEARELREKLEDESVAKEQALEKISKLETDLKKTKEDLASARRGESQADKLESEIRQIKEESEKKSTTILSLEQNIKELKEQVKDLTAQLGETAKGAAIEIDRELKKARKDHSEAIADLEKRLHIAERNASVHEDALRKEVEELRRRWQDAVRRADTLSMDVQSSTAPLLRQLESSEKQNRARAIAWAELETKLRSELEETVIVNEKLSKERNEIKTKLSRLERSSKEAETELKDARNNLEDKTQKVKELEEKLEEMEIEGSKMKEKWAEVERLANEGVSRVRSEMTKTVVESEDRYRVQLDSIEAELRLERDKRSQLERQVQDLLDGANMIVPTPEVSGQSVFVKDEKPMKLRQTQGQVEILTGALHSLGGEEGDDDGVHDDAPSTSNSYAAIEELTSRLKSAKVELTALRSSYAQSEKSRERMVEELAEARNAREKLPFFEEKVRELTSENHQMSQEIQSLQEDIAEVRELYRNQLNMLLEEKAESSRRSDTNDDTLIHSPARLVAQEESG